MLSPLHWNRETLYSAYHFPSQTTIFSNMFVISDPYFFYVNSLSGSKTLFEAWLVQHPQFSYKQPTVLNGVVSDQTLPQSLKITNFLLIVLICRRKVKPAFVSVQLFYLLTPMIHPSVSVMICFFFIFFVSLEILQAIMSWHHLL